MGTIAAGTGAGQRTQLSKNNDIISIADFFANGTTAPLATPDGVTDVIAACQKAHDALPATGGMIVIPPGEWLFGQDGTYVNISKPNVIVYGMNGSWIVSPNSVDPEVKTGARYLNGFKVTGNNCVISVNMRGPLVLWNPSAATDRLTVRDMVYSNLYNSGVSISGTLGFDTLDIDGVVFDTSRDLNSDAGNYEAISRSAASTDPAGKLIRVNRSTFRGVSGGIDAQNVRNLVIGGGTRFEGIDISCIKLATSDGAVVEQNLTVDDTVTFDGLPINPASANRHLNAAPVAADRTTAGSRYLGFIQIFSNVQFHARVKNFPNFGVNFLDGSNTNAVLNLDRSRFDQCPNAIVDLQGTVSLCDAELINSNVYHTIASILRCATYARNRMRDSYIAATKRVVAAEAPIRFLGNIVDYSVDNLAPLRLVNYGSDIVPTALVDENIINITGGGNTLAFTDGGAGTRAYVGANNVLSTGATITGAYLTIYEPATAVGTYSLALALRQGEMTLVNTNTTGQIIYDISDAASPKLTIGTVFHVCKTNNTQNLYLSVALGINGYNTARADTAYAGATFRKIAANKWQMVNQSGTWTMA